MLMKKNVLGVLLLCLMIALSACTGNNNDVTANDNNPGNDSMSSQNNNQNEDEDQADNEIEPLEFTYYDHNDATVRKPWGELPATQWVEDNMGVTINWISANGAASQKLNTMIVGEDLPDVINAPRSNGAKMADIYKLIDSGLIVPLDDYLEGSELMKWAGKENLDLLRSEDGKLYQFPVWFNSPGVANGNFGWMINRKIHKELGSPKLETIADLESYLQQVKEQYPDIVPLEVGPKFEGAGVILSAFRENTPREVIGLQAVIDGDELKPLVETPEFAEFVAFTQRAFSNKLITQDAFTQTRDQVMEKVNTGRVAVYAGNVAREGRTAAPALKEQDPDAGYEVIWPIHKEGLDADKIYPERFSTVGGASILITKDAEEPERIFNFLDWVVSAEGQSTLVFGPKGMFWDEVDENGIPIPNEKYENTPKAEYTKLMNGANMLGNARFVDMAKIAREERLPEDQRDWEATSQFNVIWKTSYDMTPFFNTEPLPDTEEGLITQRVKDIYDQRFAEMVFAGSEDEALGILQDTIGEMEDANIDQLVDYREAIWQENLETMNQ